MANIKRRYKEFKTICGDNHNIQLTDENVLRYQDVLHQLEERQYIQNMRIDNGNFYIRTVEWSIIDEWFNAKNKEDKRSSRREWMIAIISAIIGAVLGQIPFIISLFKAC